MSGYFSGWEFQRFCKTNDLGNNYKVDHRLPIPNGLVRETEYGNVNFFASNGQMGILPDKPVLEKVL